MDNKKGKLAFESNLEQIENIISKNKEKYISRLKKFVSIRSISNDDGNCRKIIDEVEKELLSLKILSKPFEFSNEIKIYAEDDEKHPIINVSRIINKKFPSLLFMGHLDTQPVNFDKWTFDPFEAKIMDNKLFGRGALDTKGQISALISALEILGEIEDNSINKFNMKLFFNTDEEIGSINTAVPFSIKNEDFFRVDAAVNCENTNERIILGSKGIVLLRFSSSIPRSLHSGKSVFIKNHPIFSLANFLNSIRIKDNIVLDPLNALNNHIKIVDMITPFDKNSINAEDSEKKKLILIPKKTIEKSLKGLDLDLSSMSNEQLEEYARKHGQISFNANSFHSGPNLISTIVPNTATTTVDVRIPIKIDIMDIINVLKSHVSKFPEIQMEILIPNTQDEKILKKFNGSYTRPEKPIVKIIWNVCKINNISPSINPFSSGTSDERLLPKSVDHIKFGAKGANNHSNDEYLELDSYLRVIKSYIGIILNFPNYYDSNIKDLIKEKEEIK